MDQFFKSKKKQADAVSEWVHCSKGTQVTDTQVCTIWAMWTAKQGVCLPPWKFSIHCRNNNISILISNTHTKATCSSHFRNKYFIFRQRPVALFYIPALVNCTTPDDWGARTHARTTFRPSICDLLSHLTFKVKPFFSSLPPLLLFSSGRWQSLFPTCTKSNSSSTTTAEMEAWLWPGWR